MSVSMVDDLEDFPGRLLHQAALWDNAELLEDLLHADQLRHIDGVDAWGRTPLHAAATSEGSSCLRILLQSGADPNVPCGPRGEFRTPLAVSAEHGHVANCRLLLEYGARTDILDGLGLSSLDLALKGGHTDCAAIIKTAQAVLESTRLETFSSLLEACLQGNYDAMQQLLRGLKEDLFLVINMTPEGSNTLLFKACDVGHKDIVQLLLDHGADARIHPVTKYSPMYIACYNGRKDIVELLLKKHPELVQVATVEKWLPSHACCMQGHLGVLELILKYPYPPHIMKKMTDRTGNFDYEVPFDLNAKDVSGQTILYMATIIGNQKMVELLLKYRVRGRSNKVTVAAETTPTTESAAPTKKRISNSIQALMSRLNVNLKADSNHSTNSHSLSPVEVDVYCDHGTQTALHVAVKRKQFNLASLLLNAGANPNLTIYFNEDEMSKLRGRSALDDQYVFTGSTVLVEAVRLRDMGTIDLLLKQGARDSDCKALYVAVQARDDVIISKLLALKSHLDPENKINKKVVSPNEGRSFGALGQPVFSSAVMINWHGQQCLEYVRPQWLSEAAITLNPKMRLHPRAQATALHAISRIDVSNNVITELPLCVFQLHSVRHLNFAQNKIERLPVGAFSCPVLEELLLQDNRLDFLPEALFSLPCLTVLDVSNNKLQRLPKEMWTAPKLKEINASFNLLTDLPNYFSRSPARTTDFVFGSGYDFAEPQPPAIFDVGRVSASDDDSLDDARMMRSIQLATNNITPQEMDHQSLWSWALDVSETLAVDWETSSDSYSQLVHLNLAHNNFSIVPASLACLAVSVTRLNLSFNKLSEVGPLCNYPISLKQLDLSHNIIEHWSPMPAVWELLPDEPTSPALSASSSTAGSPLAATVVCYALQDRAAPKTPATSGRKFHKPSKLVCSHHRHNKLENLRTLLLGDNRLTDVCLWLEDGPEEDEAHLSAVHKSKMLFPNLSALDLSNNLVREIPHNLHEFANLSVLNLSGNTDITELPPKMGLLSKLWNLNTRGCNLQEPLRSMIESKKYKTMDVVGYLKSVLEDARPYARMKLMLVGVQGIGKTSLLEQLRQEGTGSYRKKPPEHWAKRMGHKNVTSRTPRGVNLSTVGVDIGDWVYEKKGKGQSYGPVTFRTWDFAGQKEYYATHQYFLSKRSLYLVLWRITDGRKAIDEVLHWLVNIQARAPNSPVLIIGTHYDLLKDNFPPNYSEDLQQMIRDRFINVVDAEKCGLPRVLDTVEISCRTRHNIRLLCNLIYDHVFNLRLPGSKERLLEQRIPATYLALEDVVGVLAAEQKSNGRDPVLPVEQYRVAVATIMSSRFRMNFRDTAELNQATAFLHENGVMLHYEDATLKDLYFLDPQWLCDMLAHVVTIREINPFAPNGIMRLEDLQLIFRSSASAPSDAQTYVVNLLNKFEVALTWDARTLLIPSLLPTQDQANNGLPASDVRVKIPVRSRGRAIRPKKDSLNFSLDSPSIRRSAVSRPGSAMRSGGEPTAELLEKRAEMGENKCQVSFRADPEVSIYRLVLLSYVPSGFWSRLITRLLAEDSIVEVLRSYFNIPRHVVSDMELSQSLEWRAEWRCWQTGIELHYLGTTTLLRIKEVVPRLASTPFDYRDFRFMAKQEGHWSELDLSTPALVEIYLPNETIVLRKPVAASQGYQTFALEPSVESVTKLLAIAVEHIDTLLEDWYPTLGTRFVHTSEGKYLVTRLVPCPRCLCGLKAPMDSLEERSDAVSGPARAARGSPVSAVSDGADSGVGGESPLSGRTGSVGSSIANGAGRGETVYSFTIEECILQNHANHHVHCPTHHDIHLAQVAPDTMFLDLGERNLIGGQNLKRGPMLGRGAFGFVYRAAASVSGNGGLADVAMKMLQPVDPGAEARTSIIQLYKAASNQWEQDPLQYACKAYCTARQELAILLNLRHPNIVPLVGLCTDPLALVLELAPLGALDTNLRHFRRSGAKLSLPTIQQIVLQMAKALEYLHQQHIIYRDLKSENILVWSMPGPGDDRADPKVHVRLADYGISRLTLPTGAKGFGGTEGFMAPEIMRFNGEEEYTEKVDCFSFGMFMYELLTLRQPFEGHESVKELILEGGRPSVTPRDATHPVYLLDLMVLCWSQQPKDRPTASQIVSIATAPEFIHLLDVVSVNHSGYITGGTAVPLPNAAEEELHELWLSSTACQVDLFLASSQPPRLAQGCGSWLDYYSLQSDIDQPITAACLVDHVVWLGDARGQIFAFSTQTYQCVFRYALEPDAASTAAVRRLIHLPSLRRVAVALANGRLFLCRSDFIPLTPTQGEGTFVMTELGLSGAEGPLHCMAAIHSTPAGKCELWCGQSGGSISVFVLGDGIVSSQDYVNHYEPPLAGLEVLQMVATDDLPIESTIDVFDYEDDGCAGGGGDGGGGGGGDGAVSGPVVWSYVYPGCVVYRWDPLTRRVLHRLDCSKLAPCSESLQSISIEEHLSPGRCQVTSLALQGQELYIGTAWGCLVVVEASSLRPITVFRPYEDEVRLILPLSSKRQSPLIATVGKGYRNLLSRYLPATPALNGKGGVGGGEGGSTSAKRQNQTQVMLWRAGSWS